MQQSKELTQFYRDYLKWINDGAPKHDLFSKGEGLCHCCIHYGYTVFSSIKIYKEMQNQFLMAGLHSNYPFNTGSSDFSSEVRANATNKNPLRVKWVYEHSELETCK